MSRLWLFLAVALPVLASVLAPMSSVDLTYQLRAGGEILDSRSIPTIDTWTFTAGGLPWIDQQWGAQVLLAIVYRAFGWTGLVLLRAALTAVIVGATLTIARRRGLDERTAAVLTLLAFVIAAPAMALRPQLVGMACFAIVLLLVVMRRDRPRVLWLVPLVVVFWANLHGSFVLAPVILGLAVVEDLYDRDPGARRTLVVAVASVAAACITPFGPSVWTYAIGLSSNSSVTARTTEWQPTSLRDPSGFLFFASVAAVVVLMVRGGRRVPWPTLLWVGVFAAIGAVAQRGVAWWPMVAVATVSSGLVVASGRPIAVGSRPLNALVACLMVVAAIALLPFWRPIDQRTGVPAAVLTDAPPGLTGALRGLDMAGAKVLNPQRWGSWIEFAFPSASVAVDSRIEFFPGDVWTAYERVFAGIDGWKDQLDTWGVNVAITEPTDASLAARLRAIGWEARYEDTDGTVWIRPGTAHR
jgi:hypothetical protein